MVEKVLVSACLVGKPVRYDGAAREQQSDYLDRWRAEGRLVTVCPEVAGGLSVPRPPAEIVEGTCEDVLTGEARVVTRGGVDVSDAFVAGAEAARRLVEEHRIRVAVLKERSPSCGAVETYDGTFTGTLRAGAGVTAAMLLSLGVEVFGESQFAEADAVLRRDAPD